MASNSGDSRVKNVFVIEAMYSESFDLNSWICAVFDSEEKAITHLRELELEDCAQDYVYTIQKWEVK